MAGLDGTKAGWVAVIWSGPGTPATAVHVADLGDFVTHNAPTKPIAIDIPIGFLDEAEKGGRKCEQLVRKHLGSPKCNSVFSSPVRGALCAKSHDEANRINRASSPHGIGLSIQSFSLFPKLCEMDSLITPDLQKRIYEAHPEFSFYLMNGQQPMSYRKKEPSGSSERLQLLARIGFPNAHQLVQCRKDCKAAKDDVIDAMAMCWTAWQIKCGHATSLPDDSPRDARNLKMQIWG